MNFKIDTKETYVIITPDFPELNEDMAVQLCQKINELIENGSQNFIVSLKNVNTAVVSSTAPLIELHQYVYNNNYSLVFTDLQESVMQMLKKEQVHLSLNLTPTFIEAIDIIHMEILERDLLGEL